MFLPIGDTPNPTNYRPWVTWGLMAINIAVYVLITLPLSAQQPGLEAAGMQEYLRHLSASYPGVPLSVLASQVDGWSLVVFEHGYQPGAASLADLFSSMFMHAGFMHLGGNMLFLWIYGDNVEHHLGRLTYALTYLGTGVVATLSFAAFAGDSMTPLVGASGAISGVLGCYFLLFPRNRVKVFVFFFPFIMTTILFPARIVLGIFLVIDNIFPALLSSGTGGGVAYGAHIGGFLGGLALAFAFERVNWGVKRAPRAPRTPRAGAAPRRAAAPFETVASVEGALRAAVRKGDRVEAIRQARLLHPNQVLEHLGADSIVLAEWLAEADEPILAMTLLRRVLSLGRADVDQARVYLTLGLVRLSQGQPTAAYQHILAVFDHDPDEETEDRARAALRQIAVN